MGIGNAYLSGGGWMYPLTFMGIVTTALILLQWKRLATHDMSKLIWTLIGATLMMGLLATLLGLTQAFTSINKLPETDIVKGAIFGCGIALITLEFALILTVPLTILNGVLQYLRLKKVHAKES